MVDGYVATVLEMQGHRVASVRIAKRTDTAEMFSAPEHTGA